MIEEYPRVITFEGIPNFRGLGGYKARGGKTIAPGRLYRSGALLDMTANDKARLKDEIRLKTVIDLRPPDEPRRIRESNLLEEMGARYINIPFRPDIPNYFETETELYTTTDDMGTVYLHRIRHDTLAARLKTILEIIADPLYHPVLFHCAVGKDRTGLVAAFILVLLGVADEDIIRDYYLSDAAMAQLRQKTIDNPAVPDIVKNQPDFTWRAYPEYMQTFLDGVKKEYGGADGYLKKHGAEKTLVRRLEKALLV